MFPFWQGHMVFMYCLHTMCWRGWPENPSFRNQHPCSCMPESSDRWDRCGCWLCYIVCSTVLRWAPCSGQGLITHEASDIPRINYIKNEKVLLEIELFRHCRRSGRSGFSLALWLDCMEISRPNYACRCPPWGSRPTPRVGRSWDSLTRSRWPKL